jgi:hypothetical protein
MGALDRALNVATRPMSRNYGEQIHLVAVRANKVEQNVVWCGNFGPFPTIVECGPPYVSWQGVNYSSQSPHDSAPAATSRRNKYFVTTFISRTLRLVAFSDWAPGKCAVLGTAVALSVQFRTELNHPQR